MLFKLYDTYGFPLDLTEDILKNKSLKIDHEVFKTAMKKSRDLAKKNWKGSGDSSVDEIWFGIKDRLGPTDFLGYTSNKTEGVIKLLLKNNKEVNKLDKDDEGLISQIKLHFMESQEAKLETLAQFLMIIFNLK